MPLSARPGSANWRSGPEDITDGSCGSCEKTLTSARRGLTKKKTGPSADGGLAQNDTEEHHKERKEMEILNVTYKCRPDVRDRFLEALKAEGLADACRAEAGNIKYDYYLPEDGSDELLLVEKWRDEEAFRSHCEEPHFKRIGELKNALGIETVLDRYHAD